MGNTVKKISIIGVIAVCTVIAFSGVLQNGFINYDDPGYIVKNSHVQSGLTLETIQWAFTTNEQANWHPLTWLSHSLDCMMFGTNPEYHHAMNLFLHLLNSILLFLLFEKLTGALWQSAFVAIVFAIHPLHVESVAWASERKDVLSTLFWILSMWSYLQYRKKPGKAGYGFVLFLLLLGLMAKPMLVTLPFIFLLMDYWPLNQFAFYSGQPAKERSKNISLFKSAFLEKIPMIALSILMSVITYLVQQKGGSMAENYLLPLGERVSNAVVSYAGYIFKAVVPMNMAIFYPHPENTTPLWQLGGSFLLLVAITILLWKKSNQFPFLLFGWFWFIGTLIPVIGIIQVGLQAMADRYMYVPMIGLSIILAWGAPEMIKNISYKRYILVSGTLLISVLMIAGTRIQVGYWKDSITLYEHAIDVTKNNHLVENNLGSTLADSGRHVEALRHLEKALELRPDELLIHSNIARSLVALGKRKEALVQYNWILARLPDDLMLHERMGNVLADEGRREEAMKHFLFVIQHDPGNIPILVKLAILYEQQSNNNEARRFCHEIIRREFDNAKAHDVLGIIAANEGNDDEAMKEFDLAIKCDSLNGEIYFDIGIFYDRRGNREQAIDFYQRAIRVQPDYSDPYSNLGTLLASGGKLEEAKIFFLRASELDSTNINKHIDAARILAMTGKADLAEVEFGKTLTMDPGNFLARFHYGNFLLRLGKRNEAEKQFRIVLQLNPDFQQATVAIKSLEEGRRKNEK